MSRAGCLTLLGVLAIGYCALRPAPVDPAREQRLRESYAIAMQYDENGERIDDPARDAPEEDGETLRGGETYSEYDDRRDSLATGLYSGDDECTEDCSGHEAGRRWAERKGISDPEECGGKSWSFNEGCRAHAEEQGASTAF